MATIELFVIYVPIFFVATYLLKRISLRSFILIGTVCQLISAVIKCFTISRDAFWLVLLSQLFNGLSVPFIMPISAHVARTWFPENEISRATSFAILALAIGNALGAGLPALLVPNVKSASEIGKHLGILVIGEAIFTFILFVLVLIYFESKPKNPPSYSQIGVEQIRQAAPMLRSVKNIFTNSNFILLLIYFSLNGAIKSTILTMLNLILQKHFSNPSVIAAFVDLCLSASYICGTYAYGHYLDKTLNYKRCLVFTGVMSTLFLLIYDFILVTQNIYLLIFGSFVLGLFSCAFGSIGMNFAAEVTYPEAEGITNGIMMVIMQVVCVVLSVSMIKFLETHSTRETFYIFGAVAFVGVICGSLAKSDLRRHQTEIERMIEN